MCACLPSPLPPHFYGVECGERMRDTFCGHCGPRPILPNSFPFHLQFPRRRQTTPRNLRRRRWRREKIGREVKGKTEAKMEKVKKKMKRDFGRRRSEGSHPFGERVNRLASSLPLPFLTKGAQPSKAEAKAVDGLLFSPQGSHHSHRYRRLGRVALRAGPNT
jgi:hypothetical protein